MSGDGLTWVMVTETPSRSGSRISFSRSTWARAWRKASPTRSWRWDGPEGPSWRPERRAPPWRGDRLAGRRDISTLRITELTHERRQHGKNKAKFTAIAAPLRQTGIRQAARHLGAGRRIDILRRGAARKSAHLFAPGKVQEIAQCADFAFETGNQAFVTGLHHLQHQLAAIDFNQPHHQGVIGG